MRRMTISLIIFWTSGLDCANYTPDPLEERTNTGLVTTATMTPRLIITLSGLRAMEENILREQRAERMCVSAHGSRATPIARTRAGSVGKHQVATSFTLTKTPTLPPAHLLHAQRAVTAMVIVHGACPIPKKRQTNATVVPTHHPILRLLGTVCQSLSPVDPLHVAALSHPDQCPCKSPPKTGKTHTSPPPPASDLRPTTPPFPPARNECPPEAPTCRPRPGTAPARKRHATTSLNHRVQQFPTTTIPTVIGRDRQGGTSRRRARAGAASRRMRRRMLRGGY